jgi:cleavage stimulation factor subunit 3
MAATYAKKADKPDDAVSFWRAGMEANATSLLIHYGYIENEESKSNNEECHKVYNGLIERLTTQIDNLNAQAQQEVTDALEEKAKIEAQEKQAKSQNGMMVDDNAEDTSDHARAQERESIKKAILDSKADQIDDLKRLGANVWIMHMRFARRAEVS